MKRIYIAGPMSGHENLNFQAFHAAAAKLRAAGHDVVNPAEINPDPLMEWKLCMRTDIAYLVTCDTIYLLQGWHNSRGANIEYTLARSLEMDVMFETVTVGEVA